MIGFIRFVRGRTGLISSLFRALPAIFLWKAGLRSNTYAKERLLRAAFGGMPAEEFAEAGRRYADEIEKIVRTDMLDILEKRLAKGDKVAIVTASVEQWVRPWAERHGIDTVIASQAEISPDGKITGRLSSGNCHGEMKVTRILEQFPELAENRGDHYVRAYGDSSGDTAMFIFADEGIIIKSLPTDTN